MTNRLPHWHHSRRLHDLTTEGNYAHTATPIRYARHWIDRLDTDQPPTKGLYLYGNVGSGKTSIAAAIAVETDCLYWDTRALLAAMKEEMGLRRVEYPVKERCVRARVLVLDDVGKGRRSEWVVEEMQDIVERRFDCGGLTIVTSNLDPAGMERFLGAAAWSRFQLMTAAVEVCGPDLRRAAS